MKKLFLVVLYKTLIKDSKTCQFIKFSDLLCDEANTIYIWDNSPTDINSEFSAQNFFYNERIVFKHTPENVSLAKIYNTVIKEFSSYDAIQIFDQDSYIRKNNYNEYLNKILVNHDEIGIFLPKIYLKDKLYSPGLFFIKGFHFKDVSIGVNVNRFYTAITSGMIIKNSFLKDNNLCFNEKLQLYCIDTDFFCRCRKVDCRFYVFDVDFVHELSEENLSIDEKKRRRKIQIAGTKIIYEHNLFCKLFVYLYELLLRITKRI